MNVLNSDNQYILIGKKLKDFFDGQKYTQQDIADKLGVSQAAVSTLLNGKPFGKKLAQKWSNTFGLKPNWLLTGEGEMLMSNHVNNVSGNGNTSVAGDDNQIATTYIAEMLELQKGYQEMLKTSQEQITRLIAIIEKQNGQREK